MNTSMRSATANMLPRQIDARSRGFVIVTLGLTLAAMGASFALSFHAQWALGAYLGLPDYLRPALPFGVDLWILASLCTVSVLRARQGLDSRRTGWARLALTGQEQQKLSMALWTVASAGLNIWHSLTIYAGGSPAVAVGLVMVALLFPLGVLAGAEAVFALLVLAPEEAALAQAKTSLINAGLAVAVPTSGRERSVVDRATDVRIADQLTSNPAASLRVVAADLGVTVHRVRTVRSALVPTGA